MEETTYTKVLGSCIAKSSCTSALHPSILPGTRDTGPAWCAHQEPVESGLSAQQVTTAAPYSRQDLCSVFEAGAWGPDLG